VVLALDPVEVRVLGALMEKEVTTPDYYPLSLNALIHACNQKNSRDPVVEYDEQTVTEALERLRQKGLAGTITGAGLRVPKHRQRLTERLNLGRREAALLCVLMLRGAQTPGELRARTAPLYEFSDVEEVVSCLERMQQQTPPLVAILPRQPGSREHRYVHLLSGAPPAPAETPAIPPATVPARPDRLAAIEAEVAALRAEIDEIKRRLGLDAE
jgi:uncharacterized protein YceH (UPF0502 family)